jgi:D-alanyl-lipoteichoic acid acyltransferase DltB (MBOAT superfamily)
VEPAKNPIDFALFVAFFPHMVAGPIMHSRDLLPQMQRPRVTSGLQVREGLWLILWGFFKKLVVGDNLAAIVDSVYGSPSASAGAVLLGTYAFAYQIYCDFSGYTDIARGTAKLMGFELMLNFNRPYLSVNPSDFWRRWHISLSTWLRDYLYIPLGGSRHGTLLTYRNLMLTMFLGGLWHGAAWNFALWGVFHGLLLVGHRLMVEYGTAWRIGGWPGRVVAQVVTFHLVCYGWLLFRATALCSVAPLFGAKTVPARLRMALSLVLAYAAFAGAGFPTFAGSSGTLVAGALRETVLGLSSGLAARFALEAASSAGASSNGLTP